MKLLIALCLLALQPAAQCRSVDARASHPGQSSESESESWESQEPEVPAPAAANRNNIAELLLPLIERGLSAERRPKKVIQVVPLRSSKERASWPHLNPRKKHVVEITPLRTKGRDGKPLAYILSPAKSDRRQYTKRPDKHHADHKHKDHGGRHGPKKSKRPSASTSTEEVYEDDEDFLNHKEPVDQGAVENDERDEEPVTEESKETENKNSHSDESDVQNRDDSSSEEQSSGSLPERDAGSQSSDNSKSVSESTDFQPNIQDFSIDYSALNLKSESEDNSERDTSKGGVSDSGDSEDNKSNPDNNDVTQSSESAESSSKAPSSESQDKSENIGKNPSEEVSSTSSPNKTKEESAEENTKKPSQNQSNVSPQETTPTQTEATETVNSTPLNLDDNDTKTQSDLGPSKQNKEDTKDKDSSEAKNEEQGTKEQLDTQNNNTTQDRTGKHSKDGHQLSHIQEQHATQFKSGIIEQGYVLGKDGTNDKKESEDKDGDQDNKGQHDTDHNKGKVDTQDNQDKTGAHANEGQSNNVDTQDKDNIQVISRQGQNETQGIVSSQARDGTKEQDATQDKSEEQAKDGTHDKDGSHIEAKQGADGRREGSGTEDIVVTQDKSGQVQNSTNDNEDAMSRDGLIEKAKTQDKSGQDEDNDINKELVVAKIEQKSAKEVQGETHSRTHYEHKELKHAYLHTERKYTGYHAGDKQEKNEKEIEEQNQQLSGAKKHNETETAEVGVPTEQTINRNGEAENKMGVYDEYIWGETKPKQKPAEGRSTDANVKEERNDNEYNLGKNKSGADQNKNRNCEEDENKNGGVTNELSADVDISQIIAVDKPLEEKTAQSLDETPEQKSENETSYNRSGDNKESQIPQTDSISRIADIEHIKSILSELQQMTSPQPEYRRNDIVITQQDSLNKLCEQKSRNVIELVQSSEEGVECLKPPHCEPVAKDKHSDYPHEHKSYRLSFLFNK